MQWRQLAHNGVNLVVQQTVVFAASLQHVTRRTVWCVTARLQRKPSSTGTLVWTYVAQRPLSKNTPRYLADTHWDTLRHRPLLYHLNFDMYTGALHDFWADGVYAGSTWGIYHTYGGPGVGCKSDGANRGDGRSHKAIYNVHCVTTARPV